MCSTESAPQRREKAPDSLGSLDAERVCRFLGDLGHEVGTPLGSVLMMAEMLAEDGDDARTERFARNIRHAAGEVRDLVRRVVLLVRLRTGYLEMGFVDVELETFLDGLVERYGVDNGAGSRLETLERVGALPPTLVTDAVRLGELLDHLVVFATAAQDRPPALAVAAHDGGVAWTVRFQGPPLPEEPRAVFDPFGEGSLKTARRHGGAGLELALAWQLTRRLGGGLEARQAGGETVALELLLPRRGRDPLAR